MPYTKGDKRAIKIRNESGEPVFCSAARSFFVGEGSRVRTRYAPDRLARLARDRPRDLGAEATAFQLLVRVRGFYLEHHPPGLF
jgi:hypothetical protein